MAGGHVCPDPATSPTPPLSFGSPRRAKHTHPTRHRLGDAPRATPEPPPTLHGVPTAPSFRRAPGSPHAPSHPSPLARCETRASLQAAEPPLRTAATPPISTNPPLPPFLPVGARTWCTVHQPSPFKCRTAPSSLPFASPHPPQNLPFSPPWAERSSAPPCRRARRAAVFPWRFGEGTPADAAVTSSKFGAVDVDRSGRCCFRRRHPPSVARALPHPTRPIPTSSAQRGEPPSLRRFPDCRRCTSRAMHGAGGRRTAAVDPPLIGRPHAPLAPHASVASTRALRSKIAAPALRRRFRAEIGRAQQAPARFLFSFSPI
nr:uncharacterized protein LOC127321431 [Lolium perenne]